MSRNTDCFLHALTESGVARSLSNNLRLIGPWYAIAKSDDGLTGYVTLRGKIGELGRDSVRCVNRFREDLAELGAVNRLAIHLELSAGKGWYQDDVAEVLRKHPAQKSFSCSNPEAYFVRSVATESDVVSSGRIIAGVAG